MWPALATLLHSEISLPQRELLGTPLYMFIPQPPQPSPWQDHLSSGHCHSTDVSYLVRTIWPIVLSFNLGPLSPFLLSPHRFWQSSQECLHHIKQSKLSTLLLASNIPVLSIMSESSPSDLGVPLQDQLALSPCLCHPLCSGTLAYRLSIS